MQTSAEFTVYVSSSESREIHVLRMDASTGALALLEVVTVPGTGASTRGNMPLAISPDRRTLYAHVRAAPAYPTSAYAIDAQTGRLTWVQTTDLPAPMAYLSTSHDGQFLFGASYDDALMTVHRIGRDGLIVTPALQALATPPKAHCVRQSPWSPTVYLTSVTGEVILSYRFDPFRGRLEPASPPSVATPPGAGPRHIDFHPTLERVYCVNEHDGSMGVYRVDRETGALEQLQKETLVPPDFTGNALGADIHVTPDGRWVYASVRKTDTLTVFELDPVSGHAKRAGAFGVEPYPRGFAIDPQGRFLLCAGQTSHALAVYRIDPARGGLSPVGHYPVGQRPSWVEIIPAPAPAPVPALAQARGAQE